MHELTQSGTDNYRSARFSPTEYGGEVSLPRRARRRRKELRTVSVHTKTSMERLRKARSPDFVRAGGGGGLGSAGLTRRVGK